MSNEILWIIFLAVDLILTIMAFLKFGKEGLFVLIATNIIICNIQVLKMVTLFGFTVTLGNILYGSIYFSTDLLSEFYGRKEALKGVLFGFAAMIIMTVFMQAALLFTPAEGDFISDSMQKIFGLMPRIALASLIAYLISQVHDVWIYGYYKIRTRGKKLWLRNNASTMVSQLIDTVVFVFIAFWGMVSTETFISLLITTYVMKFAVAIMDTPFIYLAKHLKRIAKTTDIL